MMELRISFVILRSAAFIFCWSAVAAPLLASPWLVFVLSGAFCCARTCGPAPNHKPRTMPAVNNNPFDILGALPIPIHLPRKLPIVLLAHQTIVSQPNSPYEERRRLMDSAQYVRPSGSYSVCLHSIKIPSHKNTVQRIIYLLRPKNVWERKTGCRRIFQ